MKYVLAALLAVSSISPGVVLAQQAPYGCCKLPQPPPPPPPPQNPNPYGCCH